MASHLLRCLSTFDVSALRPGSALVAGRRVGQRPSAWKCCVPKGPRRLPRYRLRPKAHGGWREVETDPPLLATPGLFTEPWAAGAGARRVSELS